MIIYPIYSTFSCFFLNSSDSSITFSLIFSAFSRNKGDKYLFISFIGVSVGFNLGVYFGTKSK